MRPVCPACAERLLVPKPARRSLGEGLEVISFYDYQEIGPLLKFKYVPFGQRVYRQLARVALHPFCRAYAGDRAALLPVDSRPGKGFSHTAALARYGGAGVLRMGRGRLWAKNDVTYAGTTLAFRQAHPRGFSYRGTDGFSAVLVDDVVTTGTTLLEAAAVLKRHTVETLFALVLADARER